MFFALKVRHFWVQKLQNSKIYKIAKLFLKILCDGRHSKGSKRYFYIFLENFDYSQATPFWGLIFYNSSLIPLLFLTVLVLDVGEQFFMVFIYMNGIIMKL